jgi:hypothetical protein
MRQGKADVGFVVDPDVDRLAIVMENGEFFVEEYTLVAVADYVLCGCLIDRDIDAFARLLPQFYTVDDSLPRHYREALTLYTHQSSLPVVVYHDAVMDQDWEDLQKLRKEYASPNERKGKVAERYRGSYWYYYLYP